MKKLTFLLLCIIFFSGCSLVPTKQNDFDEMLQKSADDLGVDLDKALEEQAELNKNRPEITRAPDSGEMKTLGDHKLYVNNTYGYSFELPKELYEAWEQNHEDEGYGFMHYKVFNTNKNIKNFDDVIFNDQFNFNLKFIIDEPESFDTWLDLYGYNYVEDLEDIDINGIRAVKRTDDGGTYRKDIRIALHKDNIIVEADFETSGEGLVDKYGDLIDESVDLFVESFKFIK